nr:unnamed protein product [Callosobruchus analis]
MATSATEAAKETKDASASGSGSGDNSETKDEEKKDDRMFECNICLDTARDAVVSMCGHLFWLALPSSVARNTTKSSGVSSMQSCN